MKKVIITLFIIHCSLIIAQAQFGWNWMLPYPSGNRLIHFQCLSEQKIFSVGWDGIVIKSNNGGSNWVQIPLNSTLYLTAVFFVNDLTGYVAGLNSFDISPPYPNSYVFKTTDGGITYNQINSFPGEVVNDMIFFDENTGFAISGYIYKTTNSGTNWSQFTPNPYNRLYSIKFLNNNTGYVVGQSGNILKTTNQGLNWNNQTSGNLGYGLMDVSFVDSLTGFISEYGGTFLKTTNGGINWVSKLISPNYQLFGIEFINTQTGYIGGGYVFKTTNGGQNWDTITNNFGAHYLKSFGNNLIYLLDEYNYTGGIYTYNGVIHKSTDGGFNWQNLFFKLSNNNFNKIIFINSNLAYLAGNNGEFYKSTNGGNNWIDKSSQSYGNFRDVLFLDMLTGIAVSGSNILKTSNSGDNWNAIYNGSKTLNQISKTNGLLFTSGNSYSTGPWGWHMWYCEIVKSSNIGDSWNQVYSTSSEDMSSFINVYFFNDTMGLMLNKNIIYKTSNSGMTWTQIYSGTSTEYYKWFYFINNTTGFVIGLQDNYYSHEIMRKTTNQGYNWSNVNLNIGYEIDVKSIYFQNNNTGFLTGITFPDVGRSGDIMKTSDGGENWFKINSSAMPLLFGKGLTNITFTSSMTGFVTGEYGTLFKTTNGGNVLISSVAKDIPKNHYLYQNYPNPFNPSTKIKFNVASNVKGQMADVKLIIYDIIGREISKLVNEQLQPGTYEVTFDGSNLPSGVYFYQLKA